jgi:hypothetical protein
MGGLGTVDLGRHDGIGKIKALVARLLVIAHDVIGELLVMLGEDAWLGGVACKKARHMIGRASHEPKGFLGPAGAEFAPRGQIGNCLGHLIAPPHRRARLGRGERHQLAIFGGSRHIEQTRERFGRAPEGLVRGDILDDFAVVIDAPPVILDRGEILRPATHLTAAMQR